MIEKMRLSELEKFTWVGMVGVGLLVGIWLLWPNTSLVKMVPYALTSVQPSYQAQLAVTLDNQWQQAQIAFTENISQGTDAKPVVLRWEATAAAPYVAVIGPHTQIQLSNASTVHQTLSWLAWSNIRRTDAVQVIDLAAGQTQTVRLPEKLATSGQLWALKRSDSQALLAMGVYLPHDYYVLGQDQHKNFSLPNQSVRWRWLRYRPSAALPLQWEVLSTSHAILVNEGKPVQLSFETPLRQKP